MQSLLVEFPVCRFERNHSLVNYRQAVNLNVGRAATAQMALPK
jgi:hypothetical protein